MLYLMYINKTETKNQTGIAHKFAEAKKLECHKIKRY